MVWKARVESIQENSVPNDTATVTVTFYDGPKEFRRDYKFVAGTTQADARALIVADRDALRRFETVKSQLAGLVGSELS